MRMRLAFLLTAAIGLTASAGAADSAASGSPTTAGAAQGAAAVPCSEVGTTWPLSSSGPYSLSPPSLAVVRTDVRPKDARVHLDGRFAGRARFFNGKKGYLFLEPGLYRLELRFEGHASAAFEIEARPGCRFDIKQRLESTRGAGKGEPEAAFGKGRPQQWVYGPKGAVAEPPPRAPAGGPRLELRPDLAHKVAGEEAPVRDASLRLRVEPASASLYLDGALLATGEELEKTVGPLAVSSGTHVLEVRAEGWLTDRVEFEAVRGVTVDIEVVLEREPQE